MYDKETIDRLFRKYCETEDPKDFEDLVCACRPLIQTILLKYPSFTPWYDDISQEVLLKIWQNLNKPEQLRRHLVSPISFLYSRIWPYIYYTLNSFAKQNGVQWFLTDKERLIIKLKEDGGMLYDHIAEILELATTSVQCMYYIARQRRDQWIRVTFDNAQATGEIIGEFLDPAKQLEVKETRRDWCKEVQDRLSSHPYYKLNRRELLRVQKILGKVLEEVTDVDPS